MMDINEEQPVRTKARKAQDEAVAGTARLTSMRSSRVEGVRADVLVRPARGQLDI